MPRPSRRDKKSSGSERWLVALFLVATASAWIIPETSSGKVIASMAVVLVFAGVVGGGLWLLYRQRNWPLASTATPQEIRPDDPWGQPEPDRDLYPSWRAATSRSPRPSKLDTTRWSMELLNLLEWKRFEQVCAGYFEALGFGAKVTREGADGGVDIHLYAEGSERPNIIVQCKAWKAYKVGVKPLRELFGVMAAEGVTEGAFVTTGTFTQEAKEFAGGKTLHLIDGNDLLAKIQSLTQEQQQALLKTATTGDFTTPTCPSCGVKMTTRISKSDGKPFWGCSNYPRCKSTLRVARG